MKTTTLLALGIFCLGCSADDSAGKSPSGSGGYAGTSNGTSTTGATSATSSSTSATTGGSTTGAGGSGTTGTGSSSTTSGSGGATATGGTTGSGGAGGGAGSGGMPSKDAGMDAPVTGAPGCTGVVAKFCDDFEKQNMGAPTGDFTITGSGITVDSTKPFGGTKSLHVTPGTKSQLVFTKQFPFNDLHGRMMLFVAKTPTTSSHWDLIQSDNMGGTQWEVGGQFGNFELVCDPPDNGLDSKTKFPDGKWVCLQWEFKFVSAGADTSFLTQIDGVPVDQGKFTGANSKGEKWVAGPWRDLNIGFEIFGGATPIEFWIDDLAFGDQEIPCSTP